MSVVKRSYKLKKAVTVPEQEPVAKRTIKVKKTVAEAPVTAPVAPVAPAPEPAVKRTIKVKKSLPAILPHLPGAYMTTAMEAFEALREYYAIRNQRIPDEDLKWYQAELDAEAAEMKAFWEDCSVTKAVLDASARGATEVEIWAAETAAKAVEKKRPVTEAELGPMPAYGSPEFWSWCRKRKQIRLEKEAAIIAAGGTVKVKKTKSTAN